MQSSQYDYLIEQYPKYVSKDQLYKICRISKKSAKYLLDNGIIPCVDSGKKTHRYKIDLKDVIKYLRKRDSSGSMIPRGTATAQRKQPKSSYSAIITLGQEDEVKSYFEYIFAGFPDMLDSRDVVEMTGLSKKTIFRLIKSGDLKSIDIGGKFLISKSNVLDFVSGSSYVNIKSNSAQFIKILEGFEKWLIVKEKMSLEPQK